MTPRETQILERMTGNWLRPMDVGGTDASYHSVVLARMVPKGWVERKRGGEIGNRQWSWRITEKGAQALANHRALTRLAV